MSARQGVQENRGLRAWSQAGGVLQAQTDGEGLTRQAEGLELDSTGGGEPTAVLKQGKARLDIGGEVERDGGQPDHEGAGHGWEKGDRVGW